MRFTLIRNILVPFLVMSVGFLLAFLVTLAVFEKTVDQLEKVAPQPVVADSLSADAIESSHPAAIIAYVRNGQLLVLALGLVGFLGGLVGMTFAVHRATCFVDRLRQATRYLGDVVLDDISADAYSPMCDGLELEIQEMMRKIKDSQQRYLDASPLTRLPGNIAIEQVLKGKMDRSEKFALCYIDLDDFKAYNDKYGYAKGSDLIKMTGEIIYHAKDAFAEETDFVGHIGGDDFVLITSPGMAEQVCQSIIQEFDRLIVEHYHEEDRDKGYIEGTDRYGVKRRFQIMSISIAVVSDVQRAFTSPIEIARVATEIKDYVKSLPGSNYLIDRRVDSRWGGGENS